MPTSPKGRWSLPQDYFVETLRDPRARADHLRRLKRRRWWLIGEGTFFLFLGMLQLFVLERSQLDFFLFLLLMYYGLSLQENRCQQYVVELVELLGKGNEQQAIP